MAIYNTVNVFVLDVLTAKHAFGVDQLALFITNAAPVDPGNITDLVEATGVAANIADTNIETISVSQTGGIGSLSLNNKTMTATGPVGPFRYVYIYNTVNGNLIMYYDYGSAQNLILDQNFIVDLDDASNRLFIFPSPS